MASLQSAPGISQNNPQTIAYNTHGWAVKYHWADRKPYMLINARQAIEVKTSAALRGTGLYGDRNRMRFFLEPTARESESQAPPGKFKHLLVGVAFSSIERPYISRLHRCNWAMNGKDRIQDVDNVIIPGHNGAPSLLNLVVLPLGSQDHGASIYYALFNPIDGYSTPFSLRKDDVFFFPEFIIGQQSSVKAREAAWRDCAVAHAIEAMQRVPDTEIGLCVCLTTRMPTCDVDNEEMSRKWVGDDFEAWQSVDNDEDNEDQGEDHDSNEGDGDVQRDNDDGDDSSRQKRSNDDNKDVIPGHDFPFDPKLGMLEDSPMHEADQHNAKRRKLILKARSEQKETITKATAAPLTERISSRIAQPHSRATYESYESRMKAGPAPQITQPPLPPTQPCITTVPHHTRTSIIEAPKTSPKDTRHDAFRHIKGDDGETIPLSDEATKTLHAAFKARYTGVKEIANSNPNHIKWLRNSLELSKIVKLDEEYVDLFLLEGIRRLQKDDKQMPSGDVAADVYQMVRMFAPLKDALNRS